MNSERWGVKPDGVIKLGFKLFLDELTLGYFTSQFEYFWLNIFQFETFGGTKTYALAFFPLNLFTGSVENEIKNRI